jgi:hypothetical protein
MEQPRDQHSSGLEIPPFVDNPKVIDNPHG